MAEPLDNRYQKVVFSIDNYRWNKQDDEARQLMWKDISNLIQILFRNEYVFVLYEDSTDIVVLQYNHSIDSGLSEYFPQWIDEDEMFSIEEDSTNDKE